MVQVLMHLRRDIREARIWEAAQTPRCALILASRFLRFRHARTASGQSSAPLQVQFAAREHGELLDSLDALGNPKIWQACGDQSVAQFLLIDVEGAEHEERLAFRL